MAYLTGNNKVKRRVGGKAIPAVWQIFLFSSSHAWPPQAVRRHTL